MGRAHRGALRFIAMHACVCALFAIGVTHAGCASSETPTAIDVIVTEADPPLRSPITEIELIVEELGSGEVHQLRHDRVAARYSAGRLSPWSTRVLPRSVSRAGTLHRFRARGIRDGVPVVDVQSRVAFVPGRRLVLPLRFYGSCEGVDCTVAGGESTCRDGRCEDDLADPCALDPSSPGCDAGVTMPPRDSGGTSVDLGGGVDLGGTPSPFDAGPPRDLGPTAPPPPPPPPGECMADWQCPSDGLPQCSIARCMAGVCAIQAVVGERCDDGDPCTSLDVCDPTATCRGSVTSCPGGTRCDPASGTCVCAPGIETCNGRDDDCNTLVDDVPGGCVTTTCVPGSSRAVGPCGSCGTAFEVCAGDGRWSGVASCQGEGECSPGETRWGASCGRCGAYEQRCTTACAWEEDTTFCYGEGACFPGETRASGACDACEEEVCNDVCAWAGCRLRAGAECPWWGGSNWRCCAPGSWQFCLPDACVWSTDCVDCSGGGCGC